MCFGQIARITKVICGLEHILLHEQLDEGDDVVGGSVTLSDLIGLWVGEGIPISLYPLLQNTVHHDVVVYKDRVIGGGSHKGHSSGMVERYVQSSFEIPHPYHYMDLCI